MNDVPPRRPVLRAVSTALAATVAAAALVVIGSAPASATWRTVTTVHDAKLQLCKVDGGSRLRIRLDNRQAGHAHRGGLFRERDGVEVFREVRARAGRVSDVAALSIRESDSLTTLVGELSGPAAGGGVDLSRLRAC